MREIRRKLERRTGKDRIFADDLTRVASAPDAGCYRKIPQLVVRPHNEQEVIAILETLHEHQVPVTFRAAGTSLSGQAVTDSVLLQARGDRWNGYEVLEDGKYIRTGPGITGNGLNRVLAPFGRKFGPDPASVNSAMVGGIIANNAAGMSCGIHANSYATIRSARIVMADGTLLNTSDAKSRKAFSAAKPELVETISSVRDRIRSKPALADRVREKYRIKNTTGYGMNSFLDHDDPVDIILHLMVEHLTGTIRDLRQMLDELDYPDAVIYGHVLDGNLHFIFSQDFQDPEELRRYDTLLRRTAEIIVGKYNGSLKAEHGTGLNMAPFVSYEWGEEIYGFMREIKQAFDLAGILNPGVLISDDPELHLKNLKSMVQVHESVDRCIECGFCEVNCLSTDYTLSARQRIVVGREMEMLHQGAAMKQQDAGGKQQGAAGNGRYRGLVRSFRYAGDKTCAVDGLCALTCPLSIDTGDLIKQMRTEGNASKPVNRRAAAWTAAHFKTTHRLIRAGLSSVDLLRRVTGGKLPGRLTHLPLPVRPSRLSSPGREERELKVVYFSSCINQAMGPSAGERHLRPLREVTVEVLEAAGYQVIFPGGMDRLCCGTPWESKGFKDLADQKSTELEEALVEASNNGEYPVLCDTSPCIYRMRRVMNERLRLYEPVEFIRDHLLEKLEIIPLEEKVTFHITCTSTKMGLEEKFRQVSHACVKDPLFPAEVGYCGFAGDKGFREPGLNSWALRNLEEQAEGHAAGFSNSRTCEIGLSRNSGIEYKSVFYLLQEVINQTERNGSTS